VDARQGTAIRRAHYPFQGLATWRSGYAAACKAVYTGSIPVVASCLIAACGSGTSPAHTVSRITAKAPAQLAKPVKRTPVRHAPPTPRVGATELVHAPGATLSVTVSGVIDPLAGSGAALQPGTRAVAVRVRIENLGPGIYDSSATGDISVVPSSGTATPVFVPQGSCQTPLRDFDNYISDGEVRDGCVAFAVDVGAKVMAVRFSPHGQPAGGASWAAAG
jgi:hypothetical protein